MYEIYDKKDNLYREGRIRRRSDGTYEAKFIAGIDPVTGKVIHRTVCGETPDEAYEKMVAAIAARESCKMTFEEWLKTWNTDKWSTRAHNHKLLLTVKSASSKLQVLQRDIRDHLGLYYAYMPLSYPSMTFEVTPEMLADPEGLTLEDIRDLLKPWMKERLQYLEKAEKFFAQKYVDLAERMTTLDKLLTLPFSEADYMKACKMYPMSQSEYREAERLAGTLLLLSDENHVITFRLPDSPGAYYRYEYLPNSLTFQWLDEIRYEEERAAERAKDAAMYGHLAPVGEYGTSANSYKRKALTDPSNEVVWMRAIEEWLDNTRSVRDSGQSVCDFCAGPCGDCPKRWSDDDSDPCGYCEHDYGEFTECTNCPCRPDLFRYTERDAVHKSPYEAKLFPSHSCYPGSVPPPPPGYPGSVPPPAPDSVPAPDPSLVGYGPKPLSMRDD